ncbi:MAG: O-antigen ligase family protein, partial [bacterium]|nr:O-antigen ligase family protein [bacterium]
LTEKYSWLKWSLIALAALEAVLIFFTETRGTIIGLVAALALAAFLTSLAAGKHVRRIATGALVLIIILSGGFYIARNYSFIQNNHVLQRVASISLADGQTRFTIWRMAFRGVLERPLTGWGQEGFNYVFNKYYDPSLYEQEQWFDRAHNAFIDWLTAGGIPAFLLYLSLFGSAFMLLWKSPKLSRPERIALTAALVGYTVHNLFVFDNLYSYIYFFAILAFIDSQVSRPIERLERAPELSAANGITYAFPIAAVAAVALIWLVNVPGMQTAAKLITAMTPSSNGIAANIAVFEDLAAHPSFAAQEVREQIVSFASGVSQSQSATNDEKQQAVSLAV